MNQLDPRDLDAQRKAFEAGGLSVAVLLNHKFKEPRYQRSRELDPIVGVSFTGLFDFFVHAFGADWLRWWGAGRPDQWNYKARGWALDKEGSSKVPHQSDYFKYKESWYLRQWREWAEQAVWAYCDEHGLKRPNRCTTVQPAGCLTKDAIRVFDQGLLYADEHMSESQGEVHLEIFNLSVRNGIAVKKGIANDKLPLVKVTFANGRELTMTPNHKLSIEGEWISAEEMIPGMQVDFQIGAYTNPEEKQLFANKNEYSGVGRPSGGCDVPLLTSPDLGYFVGMLFGNGSLSESKYRVRFCHGDRDILENLSRISERLFGLKGTVFSDNDGKRHELTISNKQLYHWISLNGLAKTTKSSQIDRIPATIRTSSQLTILGFFAGLVDSDGCIRDQGSLSIDSASEKFLRNLQQIGEAIGLSFSFFKNSKGQNFQEEKRMFGLCLSRMLSTPDAIKFINENSVKGQRRPLPLPKRTFKFTPYTVASVEWVESDYTYDYGVEGVDYDDSWYWQGAIKSHNTKSLLTGASSGWHPPVAARFIRRITFRKNDPVALACLDYGYNVVPSQSDKDETGKLLDDPFDPRCTEWLVEIPTEVSWASLPGADAIDISQFSALAQFDFYMQVQRHYTAHNTSATISLRENEIEALGTRIHEAIQNDEGYISAALLARFDDLQTFPRLPFEPISKEEFDRLSAEVLQRRKSDDFKAALDRYDVGEAALNAELAPAGCDSDKCMLPEVKQG